MYLNEKEMKSDFQKSEKLAIKHYGKITPTNKSNVVTGWGTYSNARHAPLESLLIGRRGLDGDVLDYRTRNGNAAQLPDHLVGLTTRENFANFGIVNACERGSILAAIGWNLTVNDCFVVGGLHERLNFYAASPFSAANLFHDEYGITITGREALGLAIFGYKMVTGTSSLDLGCAFVCKSPSVAQNASLTTYMEVAIEANTEAKARKIMECAGFRIA